MSVKNAALAAAIGLLITLAPSRGIAADLSGDCCADLEARVAELESATVRHGHKKLKMVISGSIDASIMADSITNDAIVMSPIDGNRLRIEASGVVAGEWTVGGVEELKLFPSGPVVNSAAYVYVSTKQIRLNLGNMAEASRGAEQMAVANTDPAAPLMTAFGVPLFHSLVNSNTVRLDLTPVSGLTLSVSYADTDHKDVALFWGAVGNGFEASLGLGYRYDFADTTMLGSAGLRHTISGLFVQGGVAKEQINNTLGWHVQGGLEQNVLGFGASTIFAEIGKISSNLFPGQPNLIGAGYVQRVDVAGASLYLSARRYDDAVGATVDVGMAGARINF